MRKGGAPNTELTSRLQTQGIPADICCEMSHSDGRRTGIGSGSSELKANPRYTDMQHFHVLQVCLAKAQNYASS